MSPYLIGLILGALLALLVLSAILRPRWQRLLDLNRRIHQEDALKHLLKLEAKGQNANLDSVAGALHLKPNQTAQLLDQMERQSLVTHAQGHLTLEPKGRDLALHIIRSHRLWESYLADQTGTSEAHWHPQAERQEHLLTPQQTDALAAQLGHPTRDPHGDAIPLPGGHLPDDQGLALPTAPADCVLRIEHIEDEPPAIYSQLTHAGLRPGMEVLILEKSNHQVRLWAEGAVHALTPIQASNITVTPLPNLTRDHLPGSQHLGDLPTGQTATVVGLSPACRGQERRRLLDLGFVPGTAIEAEMRGPGGDPTAYRLRSTLIALRREQAAFIRISDPKPA